jgi:hypothetical protein
MLRRSLPIFLSATLLIFSASCGSESAEQRSSQASETSEQASAESVIAGAIDQSKHLDQIKKDLLKLSEASSDADYQYILQFTPEKIIEAMGGLEAAEATLSQSLGGWTVEVKDYKFLGEEIFYQGQQHVFGVIPVSYVLDNGKAQILSTNFQLAVRDQGQDDWKYISGSSVDPDMMPLIFEDYPDNIAYPEISSALLEPENQDS